MYFCLYFCKKDGYKENFDKLVSHIYHSQNVAFIVMCQLIHWYFDNFAFKKLWHAENQSSKHNWSNITSYNTVPRLWVGIVAMVFNRMPLQILVSKDELMKISKTLHLTSYYFTIIITISSIITYLIALNRSMDKDTWVFVMHVNAKFLKGYRIKQYPMIKT